MSRRLDERRAALVARSGAQRLQLVAAAAAVAPKLRTADRIVTALRQHPGLTAIGLSAMVVLGSRTLLRWAVRLAPIYSLLRRL